MTVTHEDIERVRSELRGDHSNLAEKLDDVAVRIHDKLDSMHSARIKAAAWVLLLVVSLFGIVIGRQWALADTLNSHYQHSAKYTEKIDSNDARIDQVEKVAHNHGVIP